MVHKLKNQRQQALTLAENITNYNNMIEKQVKLNLPVYAFWTVKTIVGPTTGAALEHPQLKLGPDAKQWIQGFSNEFDRLAQGV